MKGMQVGRTRQLGQLAADWRVAGVADFNGGAEDDILWQPDNGLVGMWFMNDTVAASDMSISQPSTEWKVSAVGDFDVNARADILWQNLDGTLKVELLDGLRILASGSPGSVASDWAIA